MKKLLNKILVLALLVLVPAFVVNAENTKGTITITNAVKNETYSAYKILTLETYVDGTGEGTGQFIYRVETAWENFITGTGSDYLELKDYNQTANKFVVWKGEMTDARKQAFTQAALAYAKANSISATTSEEAKTSTVTFENLDLGYYVIDSSLGSLCILTTTKPNATVKEKNGTPTVKKEVQEDSVGEFDGRKENDASIGDTVKYRTTITVTTGTENYVLFDKLSAGLTLNTDSIKVYVGGTEVVASDHFTIDTTATGTYTFKITFENSYISTLANGTKIYVEYDAVLNENAVIAGAGNPNDTWLNYGARQQTAHDTTTTYTYSFDLVKTNSSNVVLTGAKFKLYDAAENGNEIAVVWDISKHAYRVAKNGETGVEIEVTTEKLTNGKIVIIGLDSDTYYLEETQAPNGYNKLTSRIAVVINKSNLSATMSNDNTTWTSGGVHVINYTGAELPTTGGMGTVLFITIGSLIAIACGVLLVTKLRISKMNA